MAAHPVSPRPTGNMMRANKKLLARLALDLAMLGLILLSFAYQLTGNTLHEVLGFVLFSLLAAHTVLNRRWYGALFKGRQSPRRLINSAITLALLVLMTLLLLSGITNSHLLPAFVRVDGGLLSRQLHTWTAYWSLILASIHLGLHWKMVMAEARKILRPSLPPLLGPLALRALAVMLAAFGIQASIERALYAKLTAAASFDYWDFEASVVGFFAQYLAIMGMYICLTHYTLKLFQKRG